GRLAPAGASGVGRKPCASPAWWFRPTRAGADAPVSALPSRGGMAPSVALLVEPHVLEAEAVVGAVDHLRVVLDVRAPAGRLLRVQDDRAGDVLGELLVDVPHELLAGLDVRLGRLLVEERVELLVAVAGEV